ncbi:alpha/beta fold hydrolase [Bacillus sp. 2205SS5-2]|uniref:alpha/beta fold hydrolase n=1 Tax=Bacillus sp. 2205SS5-2 TaxID=3109031 RepID=UPI003007BE1C
MMNQRISTNGLAYYDRGEGEVALFLHGFCGSSAYWDEVAPLLDTHRVILVDLRGHGKSRYDTPVKSIEELAFDVHNLVMELGVAPFHLFGHSLGGYITLAYVEQFPHEVKGFGLIHSTAFPDTVEGQWNRLKAIEQITEKGLPSYLDELIPKLFAEKNHIHYKEKLYCIRQIGLETKPQAAKDLLAAMRVRADRRSIIDNSNVPVLLLSGEMDAIVPVEKVFSSDKPHIKKVILKDSGHMGMIEEPERVVIELKQFMWKSEEK